MRADSDLKFRWTGTMNPIRRVETRLPQPRYRRAQTLNIPEEYLHRVHLGYPSRILDAECGHPQCGHLSSCAISTASRHRVATAVSRPRR